LATTARREAIREFARPIPQPVDVQDLPGDRLPTAPSPEAMLVRRETTADVRDAVRALPDAYRAIVSQFLTDSSPSYRDISSSLGRPVGSIGPMRRRGLRLIERQLQRTSAAAWD
jgi:DNA-directed RNA polymerase specialized sigma24 family protein